MSRRDANYLVRQMALDGVDRNYYGHRRCVRTQCHWDEYRKQQNFPRDKPRLIASDQAGGQRAARCAQCVRKSPITMNSNFGYLFARNRRA